PPPRRVGAEPAEVAPPAGLFSMPPGGSPARARPLWAPEVAGDARAGGTGEPPAARGVRAAGGWTTGAVPLPNARPKADRLGTTGAPEVGRAGRSGAPCRP